MKLFNSVVIGCDNSTYSFQAANAIRAALESFGLRVHLYDLVQKQDTLKFLAGVIPECDDVIFCCHGDNDVNGGAQIAFQVVDQADGDYSQANGWERVKFALTPANIPCIV